jgi:hypothetical protein
MSSFFKKLGRQISAPFKKGGSIEKAFSKHGSIAKAFSKGGDIAKGLSSGLKTVSNIAGTIGKGIGSVVNNPLVQAGAMAIAPELAPELIMGGKLLSKGLETGSKLAGGASHLVNPDSYKKTSSITGHLENLNDASRRAQELHGNVQQFV